MRERGRFYGALTESGGFGGLRGGGGPESISLWGISANHVIQRLDPTDDSGSAAACAGT